MAINKINVSELIANVHGRPQACAVRRCYKHPWKSCKVLCMLLYYSYFEEEREDYERVHIFEIGKPMLIVPRFCYIHRRSGGKIVAVSGHLEVKKLLYKNLFAPALPQTPS